MSRTNIFELLAKSNNLERDAARLDQLFDNDKFVRISSKRYTLKEFVDTYTFTEWPNRGRCLDVDDYLEALNYDNIYNDSSDNIDSFLTLIEIIYNFWYIATRYIDSTDNSFTYFNTVNLLKDLMDECLSELNQKAFYFEATEQCIIAEDSPQVTAAAEATESEVSIEIVRYNHRQMSGDIPHKKAILRALGDHLEGRKKEITQIDKSLYDNITGALNNLNIRHNNISPDNKGNFKKAVAEMPPEELEAHYDDLYQLILLAILEMDNVERQRDMKELIQKVNEKET